MALVTLTCDRCDQEIDGEEMTTATGSVYTVGFHRFYDENDNPKWNIEFARPGEEVVCQPCMLKDEAYLAKYPWMRGHRG